MKRRNFIKGSVILLGTLITNPRRFIDLIINSPKPESWKDKILRLYPAKNSPLIEAMKNMPPTKEPHFSWWKDTIK